MTTKDKAVIGLTVASALALAAVIVINGLATGSGGNGIFNSSTGNISDKYETDLTPASYTFSIWAVIYIWQVSWVIYAITTIFRKNAKGRVILNPVVLPILFHVFWIISCALNITWLIVWDREQLLASFIVLLLYTLCGYATTAFQAIATTDNIEQLQRDSRKDLIAIYALIQNGTDIIFSWTTVATLLNLSIAVTYSPNVAANMSRENASTLALSILLVLVIGWSVAENTFFFKFFHFVYAWYAVLIWAAAGILVKNYDPSNRNSILTIVILVVAVICLAIKIAVYIYRTRGQGMGSKTKIAADDVA